MIPTGSSLSRIPLAVAIGILDHVIQLVRPLLPVDSWNGQGGRQLHEINPFDQHICLRVNECNLMNLVSCAYFLGLGDLPILI